MLKPFFKIKKEKDEKDYGKFAIEPLPKGFGNTLGNSLRRVLLSGLNGTAVYQIKIKGARHQFSTIPGLKEDLVEFISNLKEVNFRIDGEERAHLILSKSGPGEIKASDIKLPANVKVGNPDHYLGFLSDKKSKFEATIWIEQGTGYVPSEERQVSEIGTIPVDSFFTPILRVNAKIEETRVGRETNYDKLIVEIWTDGTVAPFESFEEAAKILVSYFEHVYNPKEDNQKPKTESSIPSVVLQTSVEELEIPVRVVNALKKSGFKTIDDFQGKKKVDLQNVRNLGAKSISLIEEKLKEKGVELSE